MPDGTTKFNIVPDPLPQAASGAFDITPDPLPQAAPGAFNVVPDPLPQAAPGALDVAVPPPPFPGAIPSLSATIAPTPTPLPPTAFQDPSIPALSPVAAVPATAPVVSSAASSTPLPPTAFQDPSIPASPPNAPAAGDPYQQAFGFEPQKPGQGFIPGLQAGGAASIRQGVQTATGQAFTLDPNAPQEPQDPGFFYKLGHGVGYSWPVVGAGIAGGVVGGATMGPWGAMGGSALAVAVTAAAQDLAPAYAAARARNMDHDAAVNYAIVHASATGGIMGLTAPAFMLSPLKTAVGNTLLHIFGTAPLAGAAVRAGVPAVMGEPQPSAGEFIEGAAQDVLMGTGFAAGHAAGRELARPGPPGPEILPPEQSGGRREPPPLREPPMGPTIEHYQMLEGPPASREAPAEPPPTRGPPPGPGPIIEHEPTVETPPAPPPPPVTPGGVEVATIEARPTAPEPPAEPPVASGMPTPAPVTQPAPTALAEPPTALAEPPTATVQVLPAGQPATPPPDDGSDTAAVPGQPEPRPAPTPSEGGPEGVVGPAAPERGVGEGAAAGGPPGDQGTQPAAAPPEVTPPAKRPVTQNELADLEKRMYAAERKANDAERDPSVSPEKVADLRQKAQALRTEYDNSQGPPTRATYLRGGGPTQAEHQAAVDAHTAAIGERIYREGQAPTPEPRKAGAVFSIGGPRDQNVVRGTDSAGRNWVGNGNVMVHADVLQREANQASKRSTTTQRPVDAAALDRVTQPDPKAKYQPITWERQVTTADGKQLVIGTLPDGTHVTLQKPIYDALHKAAGPNGSLVTTNKKDGDRVFARTTDKYTGRQVYTGVGMPINIPQEQARAYARGPEKTAPPPAAAVPADQQSRLQRMREIDTQLSALHRQADAARGQATRAKNAGQPEPAGLADRRAGLADQIAALEKERATLAQANIGTPAEGLTTEPDHVVPDQHVAKDAQGEVVGKGPTPEAALADARGEVVPGQVEAPGTTPAETAAPLAASGETPTGKTPQQVQLDKLTATRDELARPGRVRTPAEERKLTALNRQIENLRRSQGIKEEPAAAEADAVTEADRGGGPRRAGIKQPFQGPPRVGRPKDFIDYKFNDGNSVYDDVFLPGQRSLPIKQQSQILANHMKTKFGFTDVTVVGAKGREATSVDHKNAVDAMLDMTRAMQDMTGSLGLPHTAASDSGNLRLEIVPEGKTNYYGQYEHSGVIRVVGGANSFGHEWIHAIDHLLAERFTNNPKVMNDLLTRYGRNSGLDTSDNVQAAVAKLINTMFYEDAALAARRLSLEVDAAKVDKNGNPTKQALAARDQLDLLAGGGSKLRIDASEFRKQSAALQPSKAAYWASVHEMLARSGESYIARKMRQNGVDPRGVVMPDEAYSNMIDRQLRMAYPKEAEQIAIDAAWDEVFAAMRDEQILDKGQPAGALGNYGISDPNRWKVSAPGAGRTSLGKIIKTEIDRVRNLTRKDLLDKIGLNEEDRPGAINRWPTRAMDGFRTFLVSNGGMQRVIIARAPEAAQKILQPIHDSLTSRPGTSKYTPENFEEKVRDRTRGWTHQYGNMQINAGYDPSFNKMTAEEGQMLRHHLVTGEQRMPVDPLDPTQGTVPIPQKIVELSDNVRGLMNRVWRASYDAGLDIGYAKNGFFPRMYDRYRAAWEPAKFKTAARQLYGKMFDDEIGTPGDDPQALSEKWTSLPRETRSLTTDPNLKTQMAELGKNLRRQRQIEENPNPTPAEQTELRALKGQAQQLAIDAHDALKDLIANVNSDNWHANLVGGELNDFGTGVPTGKYLNARVLPPEADIIMRDFMYTDPNVAIPAYFHSVARRTARAELFGANDEVLKDAEQKLSRIEGMDGEDTSKFFTLVNDVMGRTNIGGWNRFLQTPHNAILNAANLVLMDRAVWASFSEPVTAAMVTGDVKAGFRNMFYTIQQLAGTASAHDRTALAEFLNINSSAMHDSVMLSRMGSDVSDSIRTDKLLGNFYRTTFLTQVTNGQRAATVGTSNWFLGKLGQLYLDQGTSKSAEHGREDAAGWFRELGLPNDIHKDFAQWMVDQKGALPTPEMLSASVARPGSNINPGMADAYSLAMRRLVDRIIQDPHKVDRAMLSGHPLLGLGYQLMSFAYSFQKNVINPVVARIEQAFHRGKAEAGGGPIKGNLRGILSTTPVLVHAALAATAMIMTAMLGSVIRQNLFAQDEVEKHRKAGDLYDYYMGLAVSRSGLTGAVDPVLQAFQSLRYNGSLASMLQGASITWFARNVQAALQPVAGEGSKDTNTAKYNQARAVWNLLGVPAAALGLTALGSSLGPVGRGLAGAAMQYVTSPAMAERFATVVAGQKGAERPEKGGFPKMPELSTGLPKIGEKPPEKKPGGGMSSLSGLVPWLDDIAIPAIRYVGPLVGGLSTPVKVGLGAAAVGYGAYDFLRDTADFRGQPAPKKKAQ
jgi:hypothetical protein